LDLPRYPAVGGKRSCWAGVNLPVIERCLNHVSGSFAGVVGIYQKHSFADEMRASMERWARYVEALASDEMTDNIVALKRGA
jgi:hypothetical protein